MDAEHMALLCALMSLVWMVYSPTTTVDDIPLIQQKVKIHSLIQLISCFGLILITLQIILKCSDIYIVLNLHAYKQSFILLIGRCISIPLS